MTKVLTHLKRGQQSQLCTACFCLLMCQRLTSPSDPFLQPGEEFFSNKTVEDVLVTTWTKDKMVTIPWSAKLWEAVKVSFVCESTCTALFSCLQQKLVHAVLPLLASVHTACINTVAPIVSFLLEAAVIANFCLSFASYFLVHSFSYLLDTSDFGGKPPSFCSCHRTQP